jgi:redox-sensitive bicupin YhaK (pirin superfamily)
MSAKVVTATAKVERHRRGAGLSIASLHASHLPDHLDPFLAFDHFEMAEPFFPPHPHAGFSAVTYILPESENGFFNRDSLGSALEIPPGDLHWTAAGSGVVHEEVPVRRGVAAHGMQIFVNLHSSKKWMKPAPLHLAAADVPRVTRDGADVRVVVGAHDGVRSPLAVPTEVTLLDVRLAPDAALRHVPPGGESRFVYVMDGAVDAAGTTVAGGNAAGFSAHGDAIEVRAGASGARFLPAGGAPLREPVVFHGPFCMNTREDIERAVRDYQAGRMGRLEASF